MAMPPRPPPKRQRNSRRSINRASSALSWVGTCREEQMWHSSFSMSPERYRKASINEHEFRRIKDEPAQVWHTVFLGKRLEFLQLRPRWGAVQREPVNFLDLFL